MTLHLVMLTRTSINGKSPIAYNGWIAFHFESSLLSLSSFEVYKTKASMSSMINSVGLFAREVPSYNLATMPKLFNDSVSCYLKVNIVHINLELWLFFAKILILSGNFFSWSGRTLIWLLSISRSRSIVILGILLLLVTPISIIKLIVLLSILEASRLLRLRLIVVLPLSLILTRLTIMVIWIICILSLIPIITILLILILILILEELTPTPWAWVLIVMMVHGRYRWFLNLIYYKRLIKSSFLNLPSTP